MKSKVIQFKRRFEFAEPTEPVTMDTFKNIYISFNGQVQPVLIIETTNGTHETVIGDRNKGAVEQWFADSSVVLAVREYLIRQGLHLAEDWTAFDKVTHFKGGDRIDTRLTCLNAFCSFVNYRLQLVKYTTDHGYNFSLKTICNVLYDRKAAVKKHSGMEEDDIEGLQTFKRHLSDSYPDYYATYKQAVAAASHG